MEKANELINESSPYLLQHAYNPVSWKAWLPKTLGDAVDENKLLIISIGYSSCHWCHVMERECFEDMATAAVMNEHFINIKVDREERPDIDQVYMTALQLMTGQGGWPLNIVALPDGRPVWGGTYVPRDQWQRILLELARLYREEPQRVTEYAEKLHQGIKLSNIVEANPDPANLNEETIHQHRENWIRDLDKHHGGFYGAPKFPMPADFEFLLYYAHQYDDKEIMGYVNLSLQKMALGGIYDQVGGGFSRYSTDDKWKVPHFEKMLYDNAQLISLYSKVWLKTKSELCFRIVGETIEWLKAEMVGEFGEFYSALDADSEGVEGKFYVWKESELKEIIPSEEWEGFQGYFDLKAGTWEGNIIPLRTNQAELEPEKLNKWRTLLNNYRKNRIPPAVDDKALTSWNALTIIALLDAYLVNRNEEYSQMAFKNARWILDHQLRPDGSLWHSFRHGKSSVEGLLEDYAFAIRAFIKLYQHSFDPEYLEQARLWTNFVDQDFRDENSGLYFTRSKESEKLISPTLEIIDNVIPSSNSIMGHNQFDLSLLLDDLDYRSNVERMLHQMTPSLQGQGFHSSWGTLALKLVSPHFEIAVIGDNAPDIFLKLNEHYLPNTTFCCSKKPSDLPLLRERHQANKTLIYVCSNNSCQKPTAAVDEALKMIFK